MSTQMQKRALEREFSHVQSQCYCRWASQSGIGSFI